MCHSCRLPPSPLSSSVPVQLWRENEKGCGYRADKEKTRKEKSSAEKRDQGLTGENCPPPFSCRHDHTSFCLSCSELKIFLTIQSPTTKDDNNAQRRNKPTVWQERRTRAGAIRRAHYHLETPWFTASSIFSPSSGSRTLTSFNIAACLGQIRF